MLALLLSQIGIDADDLKRQTNAAIAAMLRADARLARIEAALGIVEELPNDTGKRNTLNGARGRGPSRHRGANRAPAPADAD